MPIVSIPKIQMLVGSLTSEKGLDRWATCRNCQPYTHASETLPSVQVLSVAELGVFFILDFLGRLFEAFHGHKPGGGGRLSLPTLCNTHLARM